jgi:hypothetical protein
MSDLFNTTALPLIVAFDPGSHGVMVVLDGAGNLLGVHDTPALEEANGRPAVNAPLLAALVAKTHASRAYCEFVSARPTDARAAAFSFGRSRGVIEGVCGALAIPLAFITPPVRKRAANIPPGVENKDLARARAIARWPAHAELFARKRDIDRAEAALIGLCGLQREGR